MKEISIDRKPLEWQGLRTLIGRRSVYFYGACTLVFLYLLPMIVLGENSHVDPHDNLDSFVPHFTVLVNSGKALSFGGIVENVMGGIPRNSLPSGLNATVWLYMVFKPFTAYLVNEALVHAIAFLGMYLLLRKYFLGDEGEDLFAAGIALAFAILPFYTTYGLSIAGQPLLLYAFLNLLNGNRRPRDYLIIGFFPFYSSLVLAGAFIIFALALLLLVDWIRTRSLKREFLAGLLLLCASYAVVESQLIAGMFFDKTYTSHRAAFDPTYLSWNYDRSFKSALGVLVDGHYHAVSLHKWILLLAVPLALIIAALKKINVRLMLVLLCAIVAIAAFLFVWQWGVIIPLKSKYELLRAFQFQRFYWLSPFLWYLVLALALAVLLKARSKRIAYGKYMAVALIVVQLTFVFLNNKDRVEDLRSIGKRLAGRPDHSITYSGYFSEDLFGEIKRFIGKPTEDYRVVSIGLEPSVAEYNGFYTLDGYLTDYPLEYKVRFRKIIEAELNKSRMWRLFFDGWGSRSFVFLKELEDSYGRFYYTKYQEKKVEHMALNTKAFKNMGGEYILSAVEVENPGDNGLKLLKIFESQSSPWRIYLYKVETSIPSYVSS